MDFLGLAFLALQIPGNMALRYINLVHNQNAVCSSTHTFEQHHEDLSVAYNSYPI